MLVPNYPSLPFTGLSSQEDQDDRAGSSTSNTSPRPQHCSFTWNQAPSWSISSPFLFFHWPAQYCKPWCHISCQLLSQVRFWQKLFSILSFQNYLWRISVITWALTVFARYKIIWFYQHLPGIHTHSLVAQHLWWPVPLYKFSEAWRCYSRNHSVLLTLLPLHVCFKKLSQG